MITVITDTTTKGFVCNGYVLNVDRVALLLERALDGLIWEFLSTATYAQETT